MKNLLTLLALLSLLTGCAQPDRNGWLAQVEGEAQASRTYLEQEATTQFDLNQSAGQLHQLWQDALDRQLDRLEKTLPKETYAQLQADQQRWLADKEAAMARAGREVEGGSMYSMAVSPQARMLTGQVIKVSGGHAL